MASVDDKTADYWPPNTEAYGRWVEELIGKGAQDPPPMYAVLKQVEALTKRVEYLEERANIKHEQ